MKFYVYKLSFLSSNKIYIGKTNNIKTRIRSHLYEARQKDNLLKNNWIRKHIKLSKLKVDILFETNNENEALKKEIELINNSIKNKILITNILLIKQHKINRKYRNYSKNRLIRLENNKRNKFIILHKNGLIENISNLKKYSRINKLDYNSLDASANNKIYSTNAGNLKVFKLKDWEILNKEKINEIINEFKNYNYLEKSINNLKISNEKKKYSTISFVIFNNEIIKINSIKEFCLKNNFDYSSAIRYKNNFNLRKTKFRIFTTLKKAKTWLKLYNLKIRNENG